MTEDSPILLHAKALAELVDSLYAPKPAPKEEKESEDESGA